MTISSSALPALLLISIDWAGLFAVRVNLLELFLRGSAMYLVIFLVMRVLRRQKGGLNAADLLVLLLVADAAQNGLSANYQSLTEGAVVVSTIFFWAYLLDTLSFFSRPLSRIINGKPTVLVKDGRLHRQHMRREMLTRDDVIEQLREQGVAELSEVQVCYLERDGHFSVIKRDAPTDDNRPRISSDVT